MDVWDQENDESREVVNDLESSDGGGEVVSASLPNEGVPHE